MKRLLILAAGSAAILLGVRLNTRRPIAPAVPGEPSRPPAVVDSAVPRDVALAAFRAELTPTDSLAHGARTPDALVRDFVRAVETRDTAALGRMLLTRGEFAWVYYPTTPQGLPPYNLSPALLWFLLEGRSVRGLSRLLADRGGQPLGFLSVSCDTIPSREGENTVVGPCGVLRRTVRGDTLRERLFGPIIGRRGKWKFVSYANKLD